jgi:predicted dehydrogenase
MTKRIRVGVIGAGMAGQAHAFGYRNAMMAVSSKFDVVLDTIADPNLELAQTVADRYGFAHATGNVDALIASGVDVISVALPNFLHAEVLPKVLASGKHVFAEKPIGRTPEEAAGLQTLAENASGQTGVGFSFRRLPGLAALAHGVASGRIGDVHTVRGWYNADYVPTLIARCHGDTLRSSPAAARSWILVRTPSMRFSSLPAGLTKWTAPPCGR